MCVIVYTYLLAAEILDGVFEYVLRFITGYVNHQSVAESFGVTHFAENKAIGANDTFNGKV